VEQSRNNIICAVTALTAAGFIMACSIAQTRSITGPASLQTLLRPLLYIAAGAVAMFLASRLDYHFLQRRGALLYFAALILLALVLVPGLGAWAKGARRWFRFGGLSFQPSEFAKIAAIAAIACFAAARGPRLTGLFTGFIPGLALAAVPAGLILLEPDFGSAILLATTCVLVLLAAGARPTHAALFAAPALAGLCFLVYRSPQRFGRIMAFLDPWSHYDGPGYQVIHSLIAIGSGGVLGRGPGASAQKLFYLPEPGADFVFAVIGEEFGLIGALAVIALFALLVYEGMRVSSRAPDLFGSLLAFGLTTTIGLQAAINIAVVTASAPTKGIPLPFISAGGSSLVFTMTAVGLVLSVARQIKEPVLRPVERPQTGESAP